MSHRTDSRWPPWHVAGLPPAETVEDTRGWRYVVVEEIVDHVALLRRWRWPVADPLGHLVWEHEEEQDSTAIPVVRLREQLYTPNGLQREPRVGDTFAVIVDGAVRRWPAQTQTPERVLKGRVFDVSAEARWAARLARQGSVAAVLPPPRTGTDSASPTTTARRHAAPELTVTPRQRQRRATS